MRQRVENKSEIIGHCAFTQLASNNFQGRIDVHRVWRTSWRRDQRENKMILVGRYASPFVRRVAISLRLLGIPYETKP
jgi:hypothetical protein